MNNRLITTLGAILFVPFAFAACQDTSTSKGEKDVDTVAPMNKRFEDDTTINTVNRLSGHEEDTVTVITKDSAKLKDSPRH